MPSTRCSWSRVPLFMKRWTSQSWLRLQGGPRPSIQLCPPGSHICHINRISHMANSQISRYPFPVIKSVVVTASASYAAWHGLVLREAAQMTHAAIPQQVVSWYYNPMSPCNHQATGVSSHCSSCLISQFRFFSHSIIHQYSQYILMICSQDIPYIHLYIYI